MKKIFISFSVAIAVLFSSQLCKAQGVAINITASKADTSAMLDVSSINKGMLVPRMDSTQRSSIYSPATGLLVYQTDGVTPGFYFYNGSVWAPLSSSGATGAAGGDLTGTYPNPSIAAGAVTNGKLADSAVNIANINTTSGAASSSTFLRGDGTWAAPSAGGSIIPFASGYDFLMTTMPGGITGIGALVGFGSNAETTSAVGPTIDLTGSSGTELNYAFSMPRNGTITSISAYFSTTLPMSLIGTTITVTAQLYESTAPDNTFTAVPGATVTVSPALTGIVSIGNVSSGSTTGLSIPITTNSRYVLVFYANAFGLSLINTIQGYGSGGINIQ